MHMTNCNCAMCDESKIDYGSIKSLEKAGIRVSGSSAERIWTDEERERMHHRMQEMMEKARQLAAARSTPQKRQDELRDDRIKALQDKTTMTRGEELELLFLLTQKWESRA